LMLMLMMICCERKILLFCWNGTTDKFKRTRLNGHIQHIVMKRNITKVINMQSWKYSEL
jgi:hypothetical protein